MNRADQPFPQGNPFSTRHVRPGAIPFVYSPGANVDTVIKRLAENHWRGEIVGPHGTGKSTLVAELLPHLRRHGRSTTLVTMHDDQRRLPGDLFDGLKQSANDQLIIDGYEQLGWSARRRLRRYCDRYGSGLLVTSHQATGLPEVWRTSTDVALACRIVRRLVSEEDYRISDERLNALVDSHGGNLREVLFDLYDLYAQSRA